MKHTKIQYLLALLLLPLLSSCVTAEDMEAEGFFPVGSGIVCDSTAIIISHRYQELEIKASYDGDVMFNIDGNDQYNNFLSFYKHIFLSGSKGELFTNGAIFRAQRNGTSASRDVDIKFYSEDKPLIATTVRIHQLRPQFEIDFTNSTSWQRIPANGGWGVYTIANNNYVRYHNIEPCEGTPVNKTDVEYDGAEMDIYFTPNPSTRPRIAVLTVYDGNYREIGKAWISQEGRYY